MPPPKKPAAAPPAAKPTAAKKDKEGKRGGAEPGLALEDVLALGGDAVRSLGGGDVVRAHANSSTRRQSDLELVKDVDTGAAVPEGETSEVPDDELRQFMLGLGFPAAGPAASTKQQAPKKRPATESPPAAENPPAATKKAKKAKKDKLASAALP